MNNFCKISASYLLFFNTHGLLGAKTDILSHIMSYKLGLVAYRQACFAPEGIFKRDRIQFVPSTQDFENICENSSFCENKICDFSKKYIFLVSIKLLKTRFCWIFCSKKRSRRGGFFPTCNPVLVNSQYRVARIWVHRIFLLNFMFRENLQKTV